MARQGRSVEDVEPWFRKALEAFKGDQLKTTLILRSLAACLSGESSRLGEACEVATQVLAIQQTLDPNLAEIWQTFGLLANIATKQGDAAVIRRHRAAEREAYAAAPIARGALRRRRQLIQDILAVLRDTAEHSENEPALVKWVKGETTNFGAAVRGLLDGKRDDTLYDALNGEEALVVTTILRCLANPEAERTLFPDHF